MTRTAIAAVIVLGACLASGLAPGLAQAADVKAIGVTVGSLGNPYFIATDAGIQDAAKKLTPGAAMTVVSADYDLNKQFTQIDNFIAAGDRIIMLNAVDPVAIGPAIQRAHQAGVIVSAFDVAASGADVTVETDNTKAGAEACQYIADHLPNGGNVIIVNGPQVSSIRDRVTGCKQVLARHADLKLLSSDQNGQASRDGGLSVGQNLMTRYSKIDAVFAINDPTAIGIDLAARQLHRTDLFITSVDGAPDIVSALKEKASLIRASAAQDPFGMAAEAYRLAAGIADGHMPEQKIVLLTPTLVTRDNVGQFKGWLGSK